MTSHCRLIIHTCLTTVSEVPQSHSHPSSATQAGLRYAIAGLHILINYVPVLKVRNIQADNRQTLQGTDRSLSGVL